MASLVRIKNITILRSTVSLKYFFYEKMYGRIVFKLVILYFIVVPACDYYVTTEIYTHTVLTVILELHQIAYYFRSWLCKELICTQAVLLDYYVYINWRT